MSETTELIENDEGEVKETFGSKVRRLATSKIGRGVIYTAIGGAAAYLTYLLGWKNGVDESFDAWSEYLADDSDDSDVPDDLDTPSLEEDEEDTDSTEE